MTASAGNHAQGVALAAKRLGTKATIFMPVSTPRMKQDAVRKLGGDAVDVRLEGDAYDAASAAAHAFAAAKGRAFVHPYDDLAVMGGQGTIADEVVMSGQGTFDRVYLQIGGGGMATGVACWLRHYYPDIEIVGVEGVDQASMQAALGAGKPVPLDYLDVFCDGTAVRKVGGLTSRLFGQLVDRFVTVTNAEVCSAVERLWSLKRVVPEPSGAMGVAACLKEAEDCRGKRVLLILCGANMDFGQLGWIVRHAGIGSAQRRYYRFDLPERQGALLALLEGHLAQVNIIEFQFGSRSFANRPGRAFPVLGIDAMPMAFNVLESEMARAGVIFEDVTDQADVAFRVINFDPKLFRFPLFVKIEFPERAGALRDFLRQSCRHASICYFNYTHTGERVGRALLGLDFDRDASRKGFQADMYGPGSVLRAIDVLPASVVQRLCS